VDATIDIIRHNSWATTQLIEHLRLMPPATLELTAPGTYGSIGATVVHLLRAERAYVARLEGKTPEAGAGAASRVDLGQLAGQARQLAEEWERALGRGINSDAVIETIRGVQTAGTLVAQAVNHATEHRAHICTVLGAHGMQPPALDPFAYGAAVRGR